MKKTVTFTSEGQTLAGDLYLPDDYQNGQTLPGVVVSGSWTSVKEQMPGTYASQLADKGYAALAFDFRGWGTGADAAPLSLRYVEHPGEKTKDILAAINFMKGRDEVDVKAVTTLGICASAGYSIDAADQSEDIAAAAVVAPWLHDADIVMQVYGDHIPTLLKATEDAIASQKPVFLEAASDTNAQSVMFQADYYTDPARGAIPEYDNKFSTLTWQPWLEYDGIKTSAGFSKPLLMVHSDAAAIPQGAKKFAAQGGANTQLVMLDNVTQFDFYDNASAIDQALRLVDAHFRAAFTR